MAAQRGRAHPPCCTGAGPVTQLRTHGTLTRWNDDRGFGFITPAKGPPEVFVHISEFPREGGRPRLNELISFEVVPGPDGKQRAVRIMRPGQKAARAQASGERRQPGRRWASSAFGLMVLAAIGAYGYSRFTHPPAPVADFVSSEPAVPALSAERYSCDGRTRCPEMRSCDEARYFIRNCPNTKMDGDGDGEPCEDQWCN
jgi:cold shock CspA family protein